MVKVRNKRKRKRKNVLFRREAEELRRRNLFQSTARRPIYMLMTAWFQFYQRYTPFP